MIPATLLQPGAPANPFSTCFHAPGALEFFFQAERGAASAEELYVRFAQLGCLGQISGAHGTGKTTLLKQLQKEFEAQGHTILRLTLRDGGTSSLEFLKAISRATKRVAVLSDAGAPRNGRRVPGGILFLDGAEQLPRLVLKFACWRCRRMNLGLLATTHGLLGLPNLYRTGVNGGEAENLVARVLALNLALPRLVEAHEARAALAATHGDLREAFFRLYDLYETRWRETFRHRLTSASLPTCPPGHPRIHTGA